MQYKVRVATPDDAETSSDEPGAADPREMLAMLRAEQERIGRRMAAGVPVILLAWGVAWLVGFGLLWLIDGMRPQGVAVPLPVAAVSFAVLMAAALAASAIVGARMGRGIRSSPAAAWTGAVYGLASALGFVGIFTIGSALRASGMTPELGNLYYPTMCVFLVGVMYVVAGAIWHNRPSAAMGAWLVVLACVAPFFGYPTHYLVYALAGGGVFLLAAAVAWLWVRR